MKEMIFREDHNHAEVVILVPDDVDAMFYLVELRALGKGKGHPFSFAQVDRHSQEAVMPCGCHIFVDHSTGDRAMACDHGDKWVIRATSTTTVTYAIEFKANDG